MRDHAAPPRLLHEVSRSVFWNTALLPIVMVTGLLLSILVRRRFGLESGVYDAVVGIANSALFVSGLGLAGSLPKFLPELQVRAGRRAASRLIWSLLRVRVGVLLVIIVALNVWAESLTSTLHLGPDGAIYVRWVSVLLVGRAVLDFLYRALDSFLQQLSVNLLSLLNGVLDVGLVALVVTLGLQIAGVVGALGLSALATTVVAGWVVLTTLRRLPVTSRDGRDDGPAAGRIWKLSTVTYLRDLSLYFATPAFASPVLLSVLGSPDPVALFATSYFVAASAVTLVVSGFRGVYRPVFARVLAANDLAQLRRAFDLICKMQVLAVVPAGAGLAVMLGDYLPLLYGAPFTTAVPVARVLVVLLFAETALAVGLLVLWADERYVPVLSANVLMIVGAPLFIWAAGRFGLVPAAWVLGGSRLAASILGHLEAHRMYSVRYPWRFAGQIALLSLLMVAILIALRHVWSTSLIEATTLTLVGVVIVVTGLRVFRIVGAGELEVLRRASIPGKERLIGWLQKPVCSNTR